MAIIRANHSKGSEFPARMRSLGLLRGDLMGGHPSDRALAEQVGVSPTTIGQWLRGERFPQQIDKVLALVGAIGAVIGNDKALRRDVAALLDEQAWRDAYQLEARRRAEVVRVGVERAQGHAALGGRGFVGAEQSEAGFRRDYRQHVVEHHGKLEPPDFDRRRRVPIDDLYVSPTIVPVSTGPENPAEMDLWALAGVINRTILLGDPGGGKTTAANVLLHYFASDDERRIPFLVTLREFAAQDPPERSVAGYIRHRLETFYQCPVPGGFIERLLLAGDSVVIFDGLDELLDTSRRAEVAAIVERFCGEYSLVPVLVTSRLVGYDEARLDERQFSCYRLGSFSDEQVEEYVRKWFSQEDGAEPGEAQRSADAFLDESASVPVLRANPMLLSLMCILYRGEGSLPRNRADVYKQCASLLFRKWDSRRRIHLNLRAGHLLERILQHLAWWLFDNRQAQVAATKSELIRETTKFLHGRGFESEDDAREASSEFVDFSRGRMWVFSEMGTTAAGEQLYSFTHRTFLEYFAAKHLAYTCDTPEKLAVNLVQPVATNKWEIVAELAVQMKDRTSDQGAQRIYDFLYRRHRDTWVNGHSSTLQFLARCLRSVDPAPGLVRKLTCEILDFLFAGEPNQPVRYLPMSWLLASCLNSNEVVCDEISSRIDEMVRSADEETRLKGLRLAVWLPYGISAGDAAGRRIFPSSSMRRFWHEHAEEYAQMYSEPITAAAAGEIGLRRAALMYRLITVDTALQMPGGLRPLFTATRMGIFGLTWMAYLPAAVIGLATGWSRLRGQAGSDGFANVIAEFSAVGSYLIGQPGPPWPVGAVDDSTEYLWERSHEDDFLRPTLDPIAYLGAATTLLIVVEPSGPRMLPKRDGWQFGPLSDLYPYIARRQRIDPDNELPDLPVPEKFRKIFRDWADNKVNFTGQADSAEAPSGDITV